MTALTQLKKLYPAGTTIEYRADGSVFIWYPRGERYVVRFTVPDYCPTCGRPTATTATVEEELTI